tara:strand:+ start:5518 stop:6006 length:489 start_codon:yes stop_codon:yes gene_type:complete
MILQEFKNILEHNDVCHAPTTAFAQSKRNYAEYFLDNRADKTTATYVCTSDVGIHNRPVDIFYCDPDNLSNVEVGMNGLYYTLWEYNGEMCSTTYLPQTIEDYTFGMIKDRDGKYWYSQCKDDALFIDGSRVEGGRDKCIGEGVEKYKLMGGKFVRVIQVFC